MNFLRYLRDAAVFAPCYIAFDWASYIDPLGPFNITPWNPQAALAIVWMMLGGLAHMPAVLATILLADAIVRHMPGGFAIVAATAVVLASGYAAIAWGLKSLLKDTGLRSTRQLTIFVLVVVAGTGLLGAGFIGVLCASGALPGDVFATAWMRFWVGDAVGVLVTAPLLFAAADASRRSALTALAGRPEAVLQALVLAGTVWLIFNGFGGDPSRQFYLLFLPLIWIAVRFGMNGAIVAIGVVQLGVVLGIRSEAASALPVVELQALLVALTLTGLFLGVMVDQRLRAEEGLRLSLRLAAAGEMAGAITHEVNQPLTALANYGQSARMLLDAGGTGLSQLPAVIGKMLGEAERASEVVRRLRDFFRSGTTRLEPIEAESLLALARDIGRQQIGTRDIELDVAASGNVPALFADRLQIELILRNLLANAVESLDAKASGGKRIRVLAAGLAPDRLRLTVIDNGSGVSAAVRERLFEPFASGKATGMGLGLAICRAIAEAHGGSLQVLNADHGEFHLILPAVQPNE
jgi:two-component system sensor kinase FixL